jgi:MFS superfamily sulfate permease-like transporter
MFGTFTGGCVNSSSFMAVQATGAMAIVVADVPAVHDGSDPARALFTLSMLTGVIMLAAGFLRLGSVLRFVSNAVMTGFISAVGVNIILGQLASFTGYEASGPNGVVRTIKPADLKSVWKTGTVQKMVLLTTFALTMVIPLQYAVLIGVGLSVILHVVRQSNQITIKRWQIDPDGNLIETDPPARLRPAKWSFSSHTGACSSPPRRCSSQGCPPSPTRRATRS